VPAATCSTTHAVTNSFKPYTYFVNVDRTSDGVEIIKGCIVTLASKLTIADTHGGRVWSVKVSKDLEAGAIMNLIYSGLESFNFCLKVERIPE